MKFQILAVIFLIHESVALLEGLQVKPPLAKHGYLKENFIGEPKSFPDDDPDSYWEKSGLHEGDIMIYNNDQRNGILDKDARWPNATVPFYIDEEYFTDDEVKTILEAIKQYHRYTCIRFKPYQEGDSNWVIVTGASPGCWSSVGMQVDGQELNLKSPGCLRNKGVAMHEFLHALGFFHEQSSSNRDEYVKIFWDNIEEGHESNFNKYNESRISAYGESYDYESIMHYGRRAFSKNGEDTMQAINDPKMELGQRKGFTKIDIRKLNKMYEETCNTPEPSSSDIFANGVSDAVEWFQSLISFTRG